jgi:hypothetical protein
MLGTLKELDAVLAELAATLYREAPLQHWEHQRLIARYTPDGGVGSHEYVHTLRDAAWNLDSRPRRALHARPCAN